jgi:hypothetical protein
MATLPHHPKIGTSRMNESLSAFLLFCVSAFLLFRHPFLVSDF